MTKFFAFLFFFVTSFSVSRTVLALELIKIGVQQVSDVASAAHMAARKADVIVIPTDNLLASAVSVVARIAVDQKKPFIVSDVLLVEHGPLAGRGVDYLKSGAKAGQIASQVLFGGTRPSDIPLSPPTPSEIAINGNTRVALGLGEMP